MLKSSAWIKEQCTKNEMITPFLAHSERNGVISYGLSPFGYDIRLDEVFKSVRPDINELDPHNCREDDFITSRAERILLPPGSFILGKSVEYFKMPAKILGIAFGKSTYARLGIIVNVTPLEPGWEGFLTISIANSSAHSVFLYPLQGIAQVLFFESDQLPLFSYSDLKGKYQKQKDITVARIQRD